MVFRCWEHGFDFGVHGTYGFENTGTLPSFEVWVHGFEGTKIRGT